MIVLSDELRGRALFELMELEAAGLVTGVGSNLSIPFKIEPSSQIALDFDGVIVVLGTGSNAVDCRLPIVGVTKPGIELSEFFEFTATARARAYAEKRIQFVERATLHYRLGESAGKVQYTALPFEVLKAPS